jgi:alanine dehydrogenase
MYWDEDMPQLFSKKDTKDPNFKIKVIADITCDVEGGVPITMEATDIYNPTFGWSRSEQKQVKPFGEDTIDVMAVTNLPTELPKEASSEFGYSIVEHIVPALLKKSDKMIKKATITDNGKLTKEYAYLKDFVEGK